MEAPSKDIRTILAVFDACIEKAREPLLLLEPWVVACFAFAGREVVARELKWFAESALNDCEDSSELVAAKAFFETAWTRKEPWRTIKSIASDLPTGRGLRLLGYGVAHVRAGLSQSPSPHEFVADLTWAFAYISSAILNEHLWRLDPEAARAWASPAQEEPPPSLTKHPVQAVVAERQKAFLVRLRQAVLSAPRGTSP